jgi:hypothetical protein
MKTVVCFGASLTAGTVSFDYVELLGARPFAGRFRFHQSRGQRRPGLERPAAARPGHRRAARFRHHPHRHQRRQRHAERAQSPPLPGVQPSPRRPDPPLVRGEPAGHRRPVEAGNEARLALLSLAVIGEDLEHEANRRSTSTTRRSAAWPGNENLAYLPLHERMVAYLREHEADRAALPPRLGVSRRPDNIGNATALHATGLSWDEVSRRNGLLSPPTASTSTASGAG